MPKIINISIMKQLITSLTLLFFLMQVPLLAQKEPMYGQYFFNNSVINPAHAGASGTNQIGVLVRNQWMGIDGAPKTITAYANLRLPKQLGLAIGIYQDELGPEVNLHFQTDLAYHARLSEAWFLATGVRFTVSHLRVGLTEVPNVDPRNPYFAVDLSSGLILNTGVGLLAYSSKYFFGVAVPQTFKSHIKISEEEVVDFQKKEVRSLFTYGGGNFQLSQKFTFTPSAMIQLGKIPVLLDLNAVFGYKNILDFGPLIRSNLTQIDNWFNSVGFIVGVRFWKNGYLGYMYEYPLTELNQITKQTHEISLRFFWNSRTTKDITSPRLFL
jgi:type IX secretion system PorP/SprF family membrane protein